MRSSSRWEADPADVAADPATEGRAAGGTRARAHRPEVPRAGRRAPRLGPRPARLRAGHAGPAQVAQRARLAFRRSHRPIEAEELRWYLEKYAIWPSDYFRDRARKVEENLVKWGQLLHEAAMPVAHTANVMKAWAQDRRSRRPPLLRPRRCRRSKPVRPRPRSRPLSEAATLLLGLPWELLHDGDGYLFQGAKPTRVRRRLPNTKVARRAGRRHAHPHPARHRAAGGRSLRLHRSPRQRAAAGRGDGGARRPRQDPRARARPRCRPCARSSTAPATQRAAVSRRPLRWPRRL